MLSGRLVNLRAVEREDCELLREWRNSREVYYNLFTWLHITKEMQVEWYNNKVKNGEIKYYFVIENKRTQEPIGLIYLSNLDLKHKYAYFGLFIPNEKSRLPGVALEAELLFINYVFKNTDFRKLCCEVFEFNKAVINMHKNFGFEIEGILKEHILHDGNYKNIVIMSLLKSNFDSYYDKINLLLAKLAK